jgi:hypothetical protein
VPIQSTITGSLANKRGSLSIGNVIDAMKASLASSAPWMDPIGQLARNTGRALQQIEHSIHLLENAARDSGGSLDGLSITNPAGAEIISLDARGWIQIKDASGLEVAWLGEQADIPPLAISAATNASPTVVTINAHGFVDGDTVFIQGCLGNTAPNGFRIVTAVTTNTFELLDLATLAAINGNGGYTGGGTAQRFYGGLLTTTIAVGPSFSDYRLRAFADGTLRIRNANIELSVTSGTTTNSIIINPTDASIQVISVDTVTGGSEVLLTNGIIVLNQVDTSGAPDADGSTATITAHKYESIYTGLNSIQASSVIEIDGYTAATAFGPLVYLVQHRGSPLSPSDTQSGDTLGGIVASGSRAGSGTYDTGIRAVATENHAVGAHGTKLVFETTPIGSATAATQASLNEFGFNVVGVYGVGGVQVVGPQLAAVTSPTIATTTITQTAGITYTGNEQAMLGNLKTAVNQLNVDVANLKSTIDTLISRLQTHGLTA